MFSLTSEYAVRALIHLSRLPAGKHMLGRDLARDVEVPAHYLAKVLLTFRNAGILETSRGSHGGYRLHRRPSEIHLIEVIQLVEGQRARPECLLHAGRGCNEGDPCAAHSRWREVRKAYVDFLESTTIADLLSDSCPLVSVQKKRQIHR